VLPILSSGTFAPSTDCARGRPVLDELAYDIGAFDRSLPFSSSKRRARQRPGQGRLTPTAVLGADP